MICPCRQGIVSMCILLNVSSSVEQISLTNLNIRAASQTLLVKAWLASSCKQPGQSNSTFLLFNSHGFLAVVCFTRLQGARIRFSNRSYHLSKLWKSVRWRWLFSSFVKRYVFHEIYPGHASPFPYFSQFVPIHTPIQSNTLSVSC